MKEKRYLKWYNKVGYGSGDMAANCIYALVTSFMMIYLTDTVGLEAGWFPFIAVLIMCVVLYNLKVEQANAAWDAEHGVK